MAENSEKKTVLRLNGTPASPGVARGPLVLLDEQQQPAARARGTAQEERGMLSAALAGAIDELTQLMERTKDADSAAILEFQVAMLEDDTVTAPPLNKVAGGASAEAAWAETMEALIREYHEAEDLYFRARAADMRDLRDRVFRQMSGAMNAAIPPGSIVVSDNLPPSRFLEIAWDGGGVALFDGSPNSHVAILARACGVPMIVRTSRTDLRGHREAILDAVSGILVVSPDGATAAEFATRPEVTEALRVQDARYLGLPAATASGEAVQVLINVSDASELDRLDVAHCDGIGLVRTELLLRSQADLADEEKQYRAYRRVMEWARGKPVTIRTLDAGGDKPIPGYSLPGETNPFLGVRGVRLSLLHADLLTTQLRALARAAVAGPLKVMVPMVTGPRELDHVRALLQAAVGDLRRAGIPCELPKLGMMVEVPAAALTVDLFDADFYSIGSNDLIQYVTACGRDCSQLSPLQDPLQPAVLRLIHSVVEHAVKQGIEVSLCGDMASDVRCIPTLLEIGLRCVSVSPPALGPIKGAIARHSGTTSGTLSGEPRRGA